MIVVDASVVVKAYVPEAGSEHAVKLLTGPEKLFAPAILRTEVAAAICQKVEAGELISADALARTDHWDSQLREEWIRLVPDAEVFAEACHLSVTHSLPVSVCSYLALAQSREMRFVTGTPTLFQALRKTVPFAELLAECN